MKLLVTIALFAACVFAELTEEEKKHKPCCATKEPSFDCGDGCGGCFKNYIQKMDFYHTKPVLDPASAGKNWMYFNENSPIPGILPADDGIFTSDCHGGVVDSRVFTRAYNSTIAPIFNDAKFAIMAKTPAEVPKNGDLVFEWEGSVETFKTDQSPYPKEITQLNDFRMAYGIYFAYDYESQLCFSWYLTNDRAYVAYTRYNLNWFTDPTDLYAAFSFVIPVAMRKPCDWHNMKVAVHGTTKQVSWRLEGKEVFRVTKVGYLIDRQYMVIDYAGQEGPVFPDQMWYGFGTLTDMTAYPACKRSDTCCDCKFPSVREALADVGDEFAAELYNPLLGGQLQPATFWFDNPTINDLIWGQGVVLKIRKLVVYQDLCAGRRC